jgi:hypothetical protein
VDVQLVTRHLAGGEGAPSRVLLCLHDFQQLLFEFLIIHGENSTLSERAAKTRESLCPFARLTVGRLTRAAGQARFVPVGFDGVRRWMK